MGVFPTSVHNKGRNTQPGDMAMVPPADGGLRLEEGDVFPHPKEVPGVGSEVIALPTNGSQSAQGPRGEGIVEGEGM